MATNQQFDKATSLHLPVPSGTVSGAPVVVGALMGTARCKEGDGGHGAGFAAVDIEGAYRIPVVGAVKAGAAVYIAGSADANGLLTAASLTATSTSNTLWGYALETKSSGTATITVRPARV
jgi:predicted RecA/RadA family phage recombinase